MQEILIFALVFTAIVYLGLGFLLAIAGCVFYAKGKSWAPEYGTLAVILVFVTFFYGVSIWELHSGKECKLRTMFIKTPSQH